MKFDTLKTIEKAETARRKGNLPKALALYERAIELEPDELSVKLSYGNVLYSLREYSQSARYFHALHLDHPHNDTIWNGCALSYLKLGEFQLAEQFLKKLVAHKPEDYDSWVALCLAAGSTGNHSDTLFYAMQALQLRPLEPVAHNNLGAALLNVRRTYDALMAFQTANTLDPSNLDAMSNQGTVYSLLDEPDKAIDVYTRCLATGKADRDTEASIRYRMSYDLLKLGRLAEGWQMYDSGFDVKDIRARNPQRRFIAQRWDGRPMAGKRLLIWREQGLGDELMFLSTLPEVIQRCSDIVIECDARLIPALSRSFPRVEFRPERFSRPAMKSDAEDFDVQIPMGSLMGIFRSQLEDFSRATAYVTADPVRAADFRERLDALPNPVKIGICWRSGKLDPQRNPSYTALSDWEPILGLKNIDFINLQYGDCAAELDNARQHFGTQIHHWSDLDLRNDLDGVFALMSELDYVVTAKTAVSEMAPAIGTSTAVLVPRNAWPSFGTGKLQTYPDIDTFSPAVGAPMRDIIPALAAHLHKKFG